jgi:DNA repair protein RecO (recombination protein O)
MQLETKGLVLRTQDIADNDRVLTILTPELGVVSAFANGAKRLRSGRLAASQPLCYGDFSLYRRRDTYSVNDAKEISVFFGLREDINALALAQHFCELAYVSAPAELPAADFLELMLFALGCLEKKRRPIEVIKPATQLRMLCAAGHMPNLTRCAQCGKTELEGESVYLHLRDGNFSCEACGGGGEKIGLGVLAAMYHICHAPLRRLYAFSLPAPSLAVLGGVCEEYLRTQLPRKWDGLDFYLSLQQE